MDVRTPLDLYNSIVDITKKTGQGIPMFIVDRMGMNDEVEEMIKIGYLNRYTTSYSHLPDDVTICINGVYNVEKDISENRGTWALSYMRRWLGLDQSEDAFFSHMEGKSGIEAYREWCIAHRSQYLEWINKNLEGLEALNKLEHLTYIDLNSNGGIEVGSESYELLISRKWFTDNLLVSECIQKNDEAIGVLKQQINLTKELIGLYSKRSENNSKDANEHSLELVKYSKELDIRKGWNSKMLLFDKSELIQNVFKF